MRLGIVSDSHGHVEPTRRAVRLLESLEVDQVLHCGDIGTADIPPLFEAWPTHFVFGNCDYDQQSLRKAIESLGQHCHGLLGELELDGVRIALLHSHQRRQFHSALADPHWQVVCYGHTHVAAIEQQEGKLVLNPGALYRCQPPSLAILDLPARKANIVAL